MANHTDGIDALPRYVRDPVRTLAERLALHNQIESARMDKMRAYNEAHPERSVFGKQGKLAKQFDKNLQRQVNEQVANRAPKGATLHSEVPSTCLASLSWKDGVAYYSFYRGGSVDYSTPMSREDWLDWVAADSIGAYGNSQVFD
jgi:hypothetical protein